MTICNDRFPQGSRWLRVDFHLHTNADKEFSFTGDADYYNSDYVQALTEAGIEVGVITNHNKFDFVEFKALKKTARRKGIFLLPGMELSVNDGSNGIHTLVVFSDKWLENGNDYINQFLNVAFEGKTPEEYENENGRSSFGLIETIKKLEGYNRDFFLVFAHVEDKSGLWHELDGGRLQELGKSEFFCRRSLAFQKVRTHDMQGRKCRVGVQDWLAQAYPTEVEGSDPKSIEQIGKGEACYLKIGDFTFEAIKYALLDFKHRVASEPHNPKHSHIKNVSFEGGVLDGKSINFSSELNTLIGIRGSGKSSILEAVRYALEIEFGEKALDTDYKKHLVEHVLGSGGKITLQATDQRGQQYEIRRISREKPDVYVNGILQPGISIRDTVLHKPLYFGQKDLSSRGDGFEKDLVEKLVGEKLAGVRQKIAEQGQKVIELVRRLKKLSNTSERKSEYEAKKQDAEFRLKFYIDHGVEQKLQKQVDFDSDSRKCTQVINFVQSYLDELESFINQHEDDLNNQKIYTSKQNDTFFTGFFVCYDKLLSSFNSIKTALVEGRKTAVELQKKANEFAKIKDGLKEEFAEIERKLAEQLRASGVQAIRPDEFRNLRKTVDQATQMLKAIAKEESNRSILKEELLKELVKLNDLWHEEFKLVKIELDKVNQGGHSSLSIETAYKGDKTAFIAFMKDVFRGSRLREATFQSLTERFVDFGAMFKEWNELMKELGTSAQLFSQYFTDNIEALLTWQVPNSFKIKYRGKELKHHSLGQRASALILFILSQQENDVFLIDQPEDDLDNQTIYEDVIKLIRQLKPKTQFIFATHNANFPVLGDAEQIIACSYSDDEIQSKSGGIDCPGLQQEIVNIMEGGEDAFLQRKRRYEIWKLQNS
ncbi:TrlF family AAA-like ATPase [Desulfobacter sp.]